MVLGSIGPHGNPRVKQFDEILIHGLMERANAFSDLSVYRPASNFMLLAVPSSFNLL